MTAGRTDRTGRADESKAGRTKRDQQPIQSTMNSFAPVFVYDRWGSALSPTW